MAVAVLQLLTFHDRYAQDLERLVVPWEAAPASAHGEQKRSRRHAKCLETERFRGFVACLTHRLHFQAPTEPIDRL